LNEQETVTLEAGNLLEASTQTENNPLQQMLSNYTSEEIKQALTEFENTKRNKQAEISSM